MNILKKDINIVQVQIKKPKNKSRSFTLYNSTVDEIYNRIYIMFEELEKSEEGVMIFHHK